jgi:UDP-N-acetylmuramoyl-tripeptide--D-alanyl-D-alanine ligase
MFDLNDVLTGTRGQLVAGRQSAGFEGIAIDSRAVSPGDLFVAFRGHQQDGHEFVLQALDRGANGALVDHLPDGAPWASAAWTGGPIVCCDATGPGLQDLAHYWRTRHDITVIGVTGSVGKTSTKELIADVLSQRYSVLRTPANLNTDIGVPLSLMQLDHHYRVAVLEMAMNDVGDIRRLARIAEPELGIVTNVQPSHLERLGTIERIAEAKSELVQELPANGVAVLNADDPRVLAMSEATRARVVSYGTSQTADVAGSDVQSRGLAGIDFKVRYRDRQLSAHAALPGAHFVHAALAAIAIAMQMGFSFDDAVASLDRVERGGRVVVTHGLNGSTILDDCYNANPASMLAALDLLHELDGRRVAVLADMLELGSFEAEGHRLVGQRAAAVVDWLVAIGDRAKIIADEARSAGLAAHSVETFHDNAAAIERLQHELRRGDVVLVKGSHGMQLDEVVNAIRTVAA